MTWICIPSICLRAQEEESSATYSLETFQSALLKSKNIPDEFCCRDNSTEFFRFFRFGMMLKHSERTTPILPPSSAEQRRYKRNSSSAAGSRNPAKIFHQPKEKARKELKGKPAGYGMKWLASLGKYNRDSHCWKIANFLFSEDLIRCSEIWPKWGMMLDGVCFPLPMLAHDIAVREYGLSPVIGTPLKTQRSRSDAFMRPTKNPYELCPRGFLPNPEWVEKLMAWPIGWTALSPLATGKFQEWLRSHGGS